LEIFLSSGGLRVVAKKGRIGERERIWQVDQYNELAGEGEASVRGYALRARKRVISISAQLSDVSARIY
jgi:hypothetical protein